MTRWSEEQLADVLKRAPPVKLVTRPAKYRNQKTIVDGITFDSKAEAKRYGELKLMEKAGKISQLKCHTRWPLEVLGEKVGVYISDFDYLAGAGALVVEDVKGVKTTAYQLKKRLMRILHHIHIVEITR